MFQQAADVSTVAVNNITL